MDLTHEFTVPASREETWAAFNDIASVAECFPGATVEEATEDSFTGTVKVKLGPVQLTYKGSGDFIEKDESSGTMRISAKGKDKRGNGTAGADVVASFADVGGGSTTVTVKTDLAITGKPAQFGRGVIEDVSNKLLAQFVACLSQKVGQAEEPAEQAAQQTAQQTAAPTPVNGTDPAQHRPPGGAAGPGAQGSHRADGETLDLGATVLPVLLRSYGKQAGVALGVLLLLIWLVRRR